MNGGSSVADVSITGGLNRLPSQEDLAERMPARWCPFCRERHVYAVMRYHAVSERWACLAVYLCTNCQSQWWSSHRQGYSHAVGEEGIYLYLRACVHQEENFTRQICRVKGCPAYGREPHTISVGADKLRIL